MNGTDMELRLLEDVIAGGGAVDLPDDGSNRICYVVHGEVSIGSSVLRDDQSLHVSGSIEACRRAIRRDRLAL